MSIVKLPAQTEAPSLIDPSNARQVIDGFLENAFASGQFGPGARLPTERALAEQLRIPRSAVRNAFARLEVLGRVVRITGSGTYVADKHAMKEVSPQAPNRAVESSPLEIMATRLLIEPRLARLVVAHATQSELDYLQECLDAAELADSFEAFEEWDTLLHQAIAQASHNRLMIAIYGMITAARDQIEWGGLKRLSLSPQRRKVLEKQHRDIVAALRARDGERAEAASAEHLRTIHQNLFGRID